MSKILVIANWKCNPKSLIEAKRLFEAVGKNIENIKDIEVVVCPPFVYLSGIRKQASGVRLGAQNCFSEQKGAYTGEVSPAMLKNMGCEYVIVGHSERRQHFGETDEIVNLKTKAAPEGGLKPIVCIGEKMEERDQLKNILEGQLIKALKDLETRHLRKIIIAYEPVWAIGTGNFCSPEDAFSVNLMIRKFLTINYSKNISEEIKILYGGSVDSKNAALYIREAKMGGLLVGGASLNTSEFGKIISSIAAISN